MTFNVLAFPGGTEIGLEIQKALCQRRDIRLYSAGLDVPNHAPYVFARHFLVPSIYGSDWLDVLNEIVVANDIHYIFPAYDDILVALAEAQADGRLKARVVTSPLRTVQITRSKSQTYRLLAGTIPVPVMYPGAAAVDEFPVFLKPDRGQGAQGTQVVREREELARLLAKNSSDLALEYLPGPEYTVDCFSDREAGLLFCGPRLRVRMKSGLAITSRTAGGAVFREYAEAISSRLAFHGAWFFQVKQDREGGFKLMEIAPRIAGTMGLNRVRGVNFPLLSLYEQERIPVQIMFNDLEVELDRTYIGHYRHSIEYHTVYVDLDDTLILNGEVNVPVVRFLYQCVNHGHPLVLLTKHARDLDETLRRYRLAGLFDEVVHLAREADKSDYIRDPRGILVDDSFQERRRVSERCHILTFDCSMLEILIDERA